MKNTINQLGGIDPMMGAQTVASSLGAAPVPAPVPVASAPAAPTAIPPVLDPLVQATNPNFSPAAQNAALNIYGDAASRGY